MIKQIQLRGISRTPSDRMTADGGCAESLNVYLEENEIAPSLPPKDMSESYGLWGSESLIPEYIHKTSRGERMILRNGTASVGYISRPQNYAEIFPLENAETILDYSSSGNILIVTTNKHMHYAVWKEDSDQYTYLGTRIPEPVIQFCDESATLDDDVEVERDVTRGEDSDEATSIEDSIALYQFTPGSDAERNWNDALSGVVNADPADSADNIGFVVEFVNEIWDAVSVLINNNKAKGFFSTPVMARYAVKLYDGSYIYQSAPFLLGSLGPAYMRERKVVVVSSNEGQSYRDTLNAHVTMERPCIHKVTAKMEANSDLSNWKDLIQSIDLFISQDIYVPTLHAPFKRLVGGANSLSAPYYHIEGELLLDSALQNEDEAIVAAIGNFYRIASFPIDDLSKLTDGYAIEPISQDKLLVLPTLPDDQLSHHEVVPSIGFQSYNNRLMLKGATTKIYPGPPTFVAPYNVLSPGITMNGQQIHSGVDYTFIFHVQDPDGNTYKVKRVVKHLGHYQNLFYLAWVSYPDPNCRKVEISWPDSGGYCGASYAMKEHPLLNCSYCFIGFGKNILTSPHNVADPYNSASVNNDRAVYTDNRKILLSEVSNPFIFPIAHRITMPGDIIGAATTTRALSAGQFGQFSMYVFTQDGIYALPVTNEGTFAGSRPLSRDIAIAGTISPIDQAIVFVTERGVMLLSESDITNLSPNMNGKHYVLDEEVVSLLNQNNDEWMQLLPAMSDPTPFLAFMKEANIVYDYAGQRLLCFNKSKAYQYVYALKTGSWHKYYAPGVAYVGKLNSYPDACISALSGSVPKVLNYSTFLDVERNGDVQGVIVTRPIDFDAADVRKTIKSLRKRGAFDKGDVKYILLGSMDGHTWGRLHSLRGGSYMLFRIVILLSLSALERLSWIDADIETRFTNRLR